MCKIPWTIAKTHKHIFSSSSLLLKLAHHSQFVIITSSIKNTHNNVIMMSRHTKHLYLPYCVILFLQNLHIRPPPESLPLWPACHISFQLTPSTSLLPRLFLWVCLFIYNNHKLISRQHWVQCMWHSQYNLINNSISTCASGLFLFSVVQHSKYLAKDV